MDKNIKIEEKEIIEEIKEALRTGIDVTIDISGRSGYYREIKKISFKNITFPEIYQNPEISKKITPNFFKNNVFKSKIKGEIPAINRSYDDCNRYHVFYSYAKKSGDKVEGNFFLKPEEIPDYNELVPDPKFEAMRLEIDRQIAEMFG